MPHGSSDDPTDLIINTGTCTVHPGKYTYRNVNIYGGGVLLFADEPGGTDFWAQSILIENQGSLLAGMPNKPIGDNGGKVTIHLWGPEQGTGLNGSPPGVGIPCATKIDPANNVGPCGVPQTLWDSNSAMTLNPATCTLAKDVPKYKDNLPGNVDDCFYAYDSLTYDGGGSPKGYFGYKVPGVSFGGTLQLFGKKGASADPQTADTSGKSWARLTKTLTGSGTENMFTLDRAVDWEIDDQIVLTSTDYVASHAEVVTIADVKTTTVNTTITTNKAIQFPHYGETYPLSGVPKEIGPDPGESNQSDRIVDTRAAVGLLTRSIKIVSGSDTPVDFPKEDPNCGASPNTPRCFGSPMAGTTFSTTWLREPVAAARVTGWFPPRTAPCPATRNGGRMPPSRPGEPRPTIRWRARP